MSNINPVIIDTNPVSYKPILFTTYTKEVKYILNIMYEDSTNKLVEVVTNDKNRPYQITFKKDGKLVTATGIPSIMEIKEHPIFCDAINSILDSSDLLIELDCSSEYESKKEIFYLKDIRDIVDLAIEDNSNIE